MNWMNRMKWMRCRLLPAPETSMPPNLERFSGIVWQKTPAYQRKLTGTLQRGSALGRKADRGGYYATTFPAQIV